MTRQAARLKRPARFEPAQPTDLDPQPVQQHPGAPLPYGTRSVAWPTKWAYPQPHWCTWLSRAAAVVDFAVWIAGRPDLLTAARRELGAANLACTCPLDEMPCHRDVLLDIANPPLDSIAAGGRAVGLTVPRPWASVLLVPPAVGGSGIHAASWSTDYRGPICVYGGNRIVESGLAASRAAGLDADWHANQHGWLGAAVLVDVHRPRAGCCRAWRLHRPATGDRPRYHWVFTSPGRLALRTFGRGHVGLRPVSWSVLVRRSALGLSVTPAAMKPGRTP